MSNIDIFSKVNPTERPKWVKFNEVGKSIQGTYIGKTTGNDSFGNEQIIYIIKASDGVYNVGFKTAKRDIHDDMAGAKFGQIVGFKYLENRTVKNKAGQVVNVKIFRAVHDPKIVDEAWVKEQGGLVQATVTPSESFVTAPVAHADTNDFGDFSDFGVSGTAPVPEEAPKTITAEDKLAIISKLAKDKLNVIDQTLMKDRVMEATGLAFIPANYDKIIDALRGIGA